MRPTELVSSWRSVAIHMPRETRSCRSGPYHRLIAVLLASQFLYLCLLCALTVNTLEFCAY
jgi:hypothetical protein